MANLTVRLTMLQPIMLCYIICYTAVLSYEHSWIRLHVLSIILCVYKFA